MRRQRQRQGKRLPGVPWHLAALRNSRTNTRLSLSSRDGREWWEVRISGRGNSVARSRQGRLKGVAWSLRTSVRFSSASVEIDTSDHTFLILHTHVLEQSLKRRLGSSQREPGESFPVNERGLVLRSRVRGQRQAAVVRPSQAVQFFKQSCCCPPNRSCWTHGGRTRAEGDGESENDAC